MKKLLNSESVIEPDSGAYQLLLQIDKKVRIKIGALGLIEFKPGKYIYTGSAMKNLRARIKRHIRRKKIKRWHIDYLTCHRFVKLLSVNIFPSTEKEECIINQSTASNKNSSYSVKGFGSSDCRDCYSHLIYIK